MSWNIENIEAQKPNALCPEETLSHLAEYYPHLQACTETLEDWVRAALRDDADLLGFGSSISRHPRRSAHLLLGHTTACSRKHR